MLGAYAPKNLHHFYFRFDSFSKMDYFDLSIACSFVSESREVTYRCFLGMVHLQLAPALSQEIFWQIFPPLFDLIILKIVRTITNFDEF